MTAATLTEIMDLADAHAKAYYMGRGEDSRKKLQAAIVAAVAAEREACARVALDTPTGLLPNGAFLSERVANAIRARGTP